MANAYGNSFGAAFGASFGGADVVVARDTHDGFDEDSYRLVKEEEAAKEKAFKSARERLREVLEQAWDGPQTKATTEIKALAAPHVERLESGTLRIDYAALERLEADLLAFHAALRAQRDEEEMTVLALWS